MPFGSITTNAKTFDPRNPGTYVLTTLAFGSPTNELRFRSANKGKDGKYRFSVSKVLEKDVTINSVIDRRNLIVTVSFTTSSDFTSSEVLSAVTDLSGALTENRIIRLMQNEV